MRTARHLGYVTTTLSIFLLTSCGSSNPTSPVNVPIANVYILPGAVDLGPNAFGDEAIVIYKGERMRWRNVDGVAHTIVADTTALPEFTTSGALVPGGEKSFIMNTVGTTPIHCAEHPQMTGTLVVKER